MKDQTQHCDGEPTADLRLRLATSGGLQFRDQRGSYIPVRLEQRTKHADGQDEWREVKIIEQAPKPRHFFSLVKYDGDCVIAHRLDFQYATEDRARTCCVSLLRDGWSVVEIIERPSEPTAQRCNHECPEHPAHF